MASAKVDGQTDNSENITDSTVSYPPLSRKEYIVYRRRWFVLFVLSIINMTSAMGAICFSPIANYATDYYTISDSQVDWVSEVFVVTNSAFCLVATWLLDTIGLRTSVIFAAWLNFIGFGLRNLTTLDIVTANLKYPLLLCGQCLAAIAQPFVLYAPTKMAALWFPKTQRALANTFASMANPLGVMAANLLAPNIVRSTSDLPDLLWVCTGAAACGVVLSTFGVHSSKPPTPPSASAEGGTQPFFVGLNQLWRMRSYWFLVLAAGCVLALFANFFTFLQQILCPRGYSDSFTGLCEALMIASGTLGATVLSIIVDKTKRFEEVAKGALVVDALGIILFTQISRYQDKEVFIALVTAVFGFFGLGSIPVCMELTVELTYPVPEAASSGLVVFSGQLQGLLYMQVAQKLAQPLSPDQNALSGGCATTVNSSSGNSHSFVPQDWTVPGLFLDGMLVLCVVLFLIGFHPVYRRLQAERMVQNQKVLNQSVDTVNTTG